MNLSSLVDWSTISLLFGLLLAIQKRFFLDYLSINISSHQMFMSKVDKKVPLRRLVYFLRVLRL